MRKIKLFYTFLAFIALALNACNKEQDKPEETIQNISLEHTEVSLKVNESKIIAIQSANGSCTAKCADESKVTAIIEQNNIKVAQSVNLALYSAFQGYFFQFFFL